MSSYELPLPPRVSHETAHAIDKKLGIKAIMDSQYMEIFRGIRSQLAALLNGLDPKDLATMSLGLSHSLSRYIFSKSGAWNLY